MLQNFIAKHINFNISGNKYIKYITHNKYLLPTSPWPPYHRERMIVLRQ